MTCLYETWLPAFLMNINWRFEFYVPGFEF